LGQGRIFIFVHHAPTKAAGAQQPSTLIATAKLNDVDPQGWLAEVLAPLRIIPPSASTSSCPGIGANRTEPLKQPERARRLSETGLLRGLHRMRTISLKAWRLKKLGGV
jgi:hypothetical protein